MNARASQWRRTGRVPRFDGDSRLVLDGREQCEEGANDQGYAQVIFRDKSMGSGPMANGGAWACMFHAAQTGSIASRAILHGINGAAASSTTALLSVHGTSSSLSKQRPQTFASDASTSADGHDKQVAYKKCDSLDGPPSSDVIDGANKAKMPCIRTLPPLYLQLFDSSLTPEERAQVSSSLSTHLMELGTSRDASIADVLAALEVSSHVSRACTEALATHVDCSVAPYVQAYDLDRLACIVDSLTGALSWHVSAHGARGTEVPISLVHALTCVRDAALHRSTKLSATRFHVAATELPSIVHSYAAWLKGGSDRNLCDKPWMLTLGAKAQILAWEAQCAMRQASNEAWISPTSSTSIMTSPTSGLWRVSVSRASIVNDSLDAFESASFAQLHQPLHVLFRDELAQDAGGLKKEWLQILCDQLQQHLPWMDLGSSEPSMRGLVFFSASCNEEELQRAHLLGMAMGLALFHQVTVPLRLAPAVYMILLALSRGETAPCDLATLAQVKPDLAVGLERLLQEDPANVEQMHLTWQVDDAAVGHVDEGRERTSDLCVGGSARLVTAADREAYVARLCSYTLLEAVQGPLEALVHGFARIVSPATGRSPLSLLAPHELETLLCGRNERTLDTYSLRTYTEHVGFPERNAPHAERVYANLEAFWDLWARLVPEEQHALLGFITGCNRVPALGARCLGLRIQHVDLDPMHASRVPWSSTCTSTLFLPVYDTVSDLEVKLRIAIRHSTGFGLA